MSKYIVPVATFSNHLINNECVGHKRKASSDSGSEMTNGSSTPVSQKKPRLFFTEDQKTALRQAYSADPYPNQAAIEKLAADIGVGVKTVVNWFHNHRMRAKQQPSSGVDLPTSSAQSQVKSESGVASFVGAEQPSSLDGMGQYFDDDNSLCGVSVATTPLGLKSAKSEMRNLSAASKRKCAKPHRLATGTVLDRTEQDVSRNDTDDAVDLHAAGESGSADDEAATASRWVEVERERNIERLQRNLEQEPVVDWEF